jgi:hypothetical protein
MLSVVMPSVVAPNFTTFITTLTQQLFHKIDLIDWSKNFWCEVGIFDSVNYRQQEV